MEQSLEPPAKKTRCSYTEICVFCKGSLSKLQLDNPVVENPTKHGLKSILHTAKFAKMTFLTDFPPFKVTFSMVISKSNSTKILGRSIQQRETFITLEAGRAQKAVTLVVQIKGLRRVYHGYVGSKLRSSTYGLTVSYVRNHTNGTRN